MENISENSTTFSCDNDPSSFLRYFVQAVKSTLVVPLCFLVICFGLQQWREQRSFAGISPFDILTYNMVAMELVWIVGSVCILTGNLLPKESLKGFGTHTVSMSYYGECMFHVLASVERYLAVVYPVYYMRFGKAKGQLYHNICVMCVWVVSFLLSALIPHYPLLPTKPIYVFVSVSFAVNSFCGLVIISVLIRPRPGGTDKQRTDPKKERALLNVLGILVVLWLWQFGFLIMYSLPNFRIVTASTSCILEYLSYLFGIPSCAALPLIYLHNRGISLNKCYGICKL